MPDRIAKSQAKRWPKAANAVRLDCIAQAEEAYTVLGQALSALDRRNLDLVRQRIVDARKDSNLIRMMLQHAAPGDDTDNGPAIEVMRAEVERMRAEISGLNEMIRNLLVLLEAEEIARLVDDQKTGKTRRWRRGIR